MDNAEEAGKYRIENDRLIQGQAIGDGNTVYNIYQQKPVQQKPPPDQVWMVPFQRNRFFLGQETLLAELHQNLRRGTTTALTQIQAISGLGGIGKTQLALEYAYRYREVYPFVFWIRAEHRETLITDLLTLAGHLHLPQQDEAEPMKIVAAVLQWLTRSRRWLLIFDNADDLALLAEFVPPYHAGAILLTTRVAQTQPLAAPLLVEHMDERVGAELLLRRARILGMGQVLEDATSEDQQAARQICHLVGGLPLALDQAGAYIDETQCRVQDYLSFYQQDQQVRTRLLQRRGKGPGHPEAVATTLALAFAQVAQASAAAADLLRACAFLYPDLIPETLLQQGASRWSASLAQVAKDTFQWNETLGELLKYGLLRRSREQQALSIHRLVQTVLRDALDGPTTRQWAERTVQAVTQVFPEGSDPANWETCKRLLPHGQRCAELIVQEGFSSSEAATLLLRIANYLRELAWYHEAEPLYQRALHIREQQLGSDHPYVAYPLTGLANLYSDQGQLAQAERLYLRALRIREQRLGPDHPDVADSLNNLALLYKGQGQLAQAEQLYQRALRIREQQLGPDHPDVADSLNNLASLYDELGRYAQAEQLYQRALSTLEQQLGPDHPYVAYSLNGLASLYYQQGKYVQAEQLYQRSLRIWEQRLGTDHHLTRQVRKNYAILLHVMNRHDEAEQLEAEED